VCLDQNRVRVGSSFCQEPPPQPDNQRGAKDDACSRSPAFIAECRAGQHRRQARCPSGVAPFATHVWGGGNATLSPSSRCRSPFASTCGSRAATTPATPAPHRRRLLCSCHQVSAWFFLTPYTARTLFSTSCRAPSSVHLDDRRSLHDDGQPRRMDLNIF
jgi:hypothetical protein